MGFEAKDILPWIPTAIGAVKDVVAGFSPRAAEAIGFGGELATFIIDAESNGALEEAIVQGVVDLSAKLVERLKFGP